MGINSPGVPGSNLPAGEDFMQRQIKDLQRDLRELAPSVSKSFAPVITRLDATDADLAAKDADLAAKDVQIEALIGSQVLPTTAHEDNGVTNFAVTTTRTAQATATVTVPTGYTQALIFATGQASAVNSTAIVDTLYVGAAVNGVEPPGWAATQDVAPGGLGGATRAVVKLLTGLTGGGTFTVSTRIYSAYAGWASSSANSCNIDATVVFLK